MKKHKRIKLGMVGGGHGSFIGIAHRIAAYMTEDYELTGGAFSSDFSGAKDFARGLQLDDKRVYEDVPALIQGESALPLEERMEAVVIVTPNYLHYDAAKALIESGFHVISDKPITISHAEALYLQSMVKKHSVVFCVTHTYTGYPMVRQMKAMIASGVIGEIQKVDAQYYQGWINPVVHSAETRKGIWRLDPEKAGISSCMGDIGVHAFNMIEYTTGLEVKKVLADLHTLYPDNPLDIDGTVLLRLDNDVRGIVRASQVATGEENNLTIAVYGRKGGFRWEQENPNYLYHLKEGEPMQVLKPANPYNSGFSQEATKIAPGHPEGIFDAMGNIYKGAARAIRGEQVAEGAYPDIRDGVRGMNFIEKAVESSKAGNQWLEF
ncbi:Gfo/Idh/MocA family oxidoreductase [Fulvivirga sp. M361]|uniref:Gfo/Idh/MocA family protein n=1 Tax=Fulvivirga sp. M361 TaxID=2594266 RepID=UPI00117B2276|nr:Gfo/Idh/MocA family oxidoreductase [Fulvivirga sp. M361]TRX61179.1 Gfo/Idh/MocA family oxidoreductase [Fulvivirga sp. M361]